MSLRSQGIVSQQYLLRYFTPPLCPLLRATCRSLKYFNKFTSRAHLLVPHTTSCGLYLNLLVSSCFILRPSPLHSVFTVKQLLLARWLHVRCFLSLPLTLPTQCVLLPWNIAESSKTSCSILQGSMEACRLSFRCRRLVDSQPRMLENVLSLLLIDAVSRSHWLGESSNIVAARATYEAERRAWTAQSIRKVRLSAPADASASSQVSD